jgi:diaminopimelate epimerase
MNFCIFDSGRSDRRQAASRRPGLRVGQGMTMLTPMTLRFHKMNGAGNDFIVVDNRDLSIPLSPGTIEALCDRHRGIGADGLLAVEPAQHGADFRFRYYNADGGEAEMCGNGARCFGRYTAALDGTKRNRVTFETIAGVLAADIVGDQVRIAMSDPKDLKLDSTVSVPGLGTALHFINTGVPHAVAFLSDADALQQCNVVTLGRTIRRHDAFSPAGTNANFAAAIEPGHIAIRTYERGVEDETLACGTGVTACALIHHLLSGAASPIKVDVAGGDTLEIGFTRNADGSFAEVTLTGPADFVFEGTIDIIA